MRKSTVSTILFKLILISLITLSSCDYLSHQDQVIHLSEDYKNKPQKKFWAIDFKKSKYSYVYYQITASLLAEGEKCNVWAEHGSGVTSETAKKTANAYDNQIYQKMTDTFYPDKFTTNDGIQLNIMDFADSEYGDNDGKLCILLMDIKDEYKKGTNDSFIAGYFFAYNFYRGYNSNECDMIYIDTYPGKPGSNDSNAVLAHEMQHLMNFIVSLKIRAGSFFDTWIDEGLSSAAEWSYLGSHPEIRWLWFENNGGGLGNIDKGNNFFVWDNYSENQYALLDDYATVYMFFQWLRLHSDTAIYKDIMASKDADYRAVTGAAADRIDLKYSNNWPLLLQDWLTANYLNISGSRYGYKDDPVLSKIEFNNYAPPQTSINLAQGEGVYSIIEQSNYSMPKPSGNIRYICLDRNTGTIQSDPVVSAALLTYNINKDQKGRSERGVTTGFPKDDAEKSRMIGFPLTGPFPVGPVFRITDYE